MKDRDKLDMSLVMNTSQFSDKSVMNGVIRLCRKCYRYVILYYLEDSPYANIPTISSSWELCHDFSKYGCDYIPIALVKDIKSNEGTK